MKELSALRKLKAVWRDQIFWDRKLTPATFKVGYAMADCITLDKTVNEYRKSRRVIIFPSHMTIHETANVSVDTVVEGIKQLMHRGHLRRVKRGNQFIGSNHYRVLVKETE